MRRAAAFILLLGLLAITGGADDATPPRPLPNPPAHATAEAATAPAVVTFVPVDVFIDPQGKSLACYQVEIVATTGNVKLTGIEGGEDVNFGDAPYYDPRALLYGQRVIIGAYTLGGDLPTGKTRVARLMFQVTGPVEPHYQATLRVAGSSDEKAIPAIVSLVARSAPRRAAIDKPAFTGGLE